MELFDHYIDPTRNLLPNDGIVNYHNKILSKVEADYYFERLFTTIDWRQDEAVIFGKHIFTKRKVAWYGDKPFDYRYSNTSKQALRWTQELQVLKKLAEEKTKETYNSCLMNLYHSGEEGMAWHSDGEKDLKRNGAIASITLGAERRFGFKHKKTGQKVMMTLEHGSLMVMKGETQTFWLHRLPPTKKIQQPRINLTFRTIVGQ